jgi:cyclic pyranopterin phosphate synthase
MTGFDGLPQALEGMSTAIEIDLTPVSLNCVVMRRSNFSQVLPLAEMALGLPLAVRFIEYYPTTRITGSADEYVPNAEVRRIIESRLGPLSRTVVTDAGGPVEYFKIKGATGTIGFISGRSSMFCADRSYDVRKLLRGGADDPSIQDLIQRVLREKRRYTKTTSTAEDFLMQSIGG